MTITRRDLLRWAAATGAALPLRAGAAPQRAAGKRLLILGGTGFIGPHIVEAARRQGMTVSLFNRGKTRPGLFPDVEHLLGDRDGNLKALAGHAWDAVIDTSGYVPRLVRDSAEALRGAVKQYVFISTISVYDDASKPIDEDSALSPLKGQPTEEGGPGTYGPLKALCEAAAEKALPGRVTTIRPGLIVGPGDPTDRFTYWPVRLSRGGEVLAPGERTDPVQFIDVRDLAQWTVGMVASATTGIYNAVGPGGGLGIGGLLDACRAASKPDATLTWVDAGFLEQNKVSPWSDLPVWVPPRGEMAYITRISARRAIDKGLRSRPVADTVQATLAYWNGLPQDRRAKLHAGLSPEREKEVLAAWHARKKS